MTRLKPTIKSLLLLMGFGWLSMSSHAVSISKPQQDEPTQNLLYGTWCDPKTNEWIIGFLDVYKRQVSCNETSCSMAARWPSTKTSPCWAGAFSCKAGCSGWIYSPKGRSRSSPPPCWSAIRKVSPGTIPWSGISGLNPYGMKRPKSNMRCV